MCVEPSPLFAQIIGASRPMLSVMARLKEIASSTGPVLICGEPGTGRTLAARAIHRTGAQAQGPFLVQDCTVAAQEDLDSDLFGCAAGALPGASKDRQGALEGADGGSVLFHGIESLDRILQAKLLRFLDEAGSRRIGEAALRPVKTRALFAAGPGLDESLRAGRLRGDLYHRISLLQLELPPLRERKGDIELLVEDYFRRSARHNGIAKPEISRDGLAALDAYDWPGNVAELYNVLERGIVHSGGRPLAPQHFGMRAPECSRPKTLAQIRAETEHQHIQRCLESCGGNITRAANALGVHRQQLQRLIKRYDLKPSAPERRRIRP